MAMLLTTQAAQAIDQPAIKLGVKSFWVVDAKLDVTKLTLQATGRAPCQILADSSRVVGFKWDRLR